MQIAQDLGYAVHERPLIRSDLYLADELFMTGTAAEVTPVRVDRRPRDRRAGPVTKAIQSTFLDVVRGRDERWYALARVRRPRRRPGVLTPREIGLSAPWLEEREEELVLEALRSGRLSLGPMIDRFEQALAERVGAPYVAAVSSGTAGLHLLCGSAGLGPGDEVDHVAVLVRRLRELRPLRGRDAGLRRHRPADAEPRSRRRSRPRSRRARRRSSPSTSSATRASSTELASDRRAARARARSRTPARRSAPSTAAGRSAPTAHPAVFAFYPNKQITTGEGGAVAVHDRGGVAAPEEPLATRAAPTPAAGSSTRASATTTASTTSRRRSGSRSSRSSTAILELRAEVAARYAELLGRLDGVEPPLAGRRRPLRSWFVYVVRLAEGIDRDGVIARLAERGIATQPYLPSIHLQPYMRERFGTQEGHVPGLRGGEPALLALPFHTRLERADDQERVAEALGRRSACAT